MSESTGPFSVWVGSDLDLRLDGFTTYALAGGVGPRHLGIANFDSTEAAWAVRPGSEDLVWWLHWTRISRLGEPGDPARYLFVVGMDPAPGSDNQALAEFDRFYTEVHMPEIVSAGSYACGTRLRRLGAPATPEFCAVYDADEEAGRVKLSAMTSRGPRPAYSEGPPAWQGRVIAWRLLYERVTP